MAKFTPVVVGLEDLQRKVSALKDSASSAKVKHAFKTAAYIAENAVWAVTPVRTGRLRDSLNSGLLDDEVGSFVAANAYYASSLETGTPPRVTKSGKSTGRGPKTRFFSNGIRKGRQRFRSYLIGELQKAVEDAAK